jgi:MFS family permease
MTAASHRRRFVALSALRWLPVGLVVPVLVLHLGARGLALGEVGLLLSGYSLVALLLELPTGGLADVIGQRGVVVAAAAASAAGLLVLALASPPALLALGLAALGLGRALASGPLDSWYVEGLRALAPAQPIDAGLAGGQAAGSLALGLGALAGGAIPALTSWPAEGTGLIATSAPFLAAAALTLVSGAFAMTWLPRRAQRPAEDPGSGRGLAARTAATVREGLRLAWTSPMLRRLIAVSLILGVLLSGVELLSPGIVADLAGGTTEGAAVYGVLAALGFAAAAAGALLGPRLIRGRASRPRVAAAAYLGMGVAVLALAAPVLAGAAACYLVVYLLIGVQGPLTSSLLHDEVPDSTRSTMLSMESLALMAGGVAASAGLGAAAAAFGVPPVLVALALAAAAAALLLVGARPTPKAQPAAQDS